MEFREGRLGRFPFGSVLIAALLVCGTASASATSSGLAAREPSAPKVWYGWQILAVDLLDTAVATVPAAENSTGGHDVNTPLVLFEVTAGVVYVAGGPVVHLAHGQGGRAGISLALRAGAPLVLGLTGLALGWGSLWGFVGLGLGAGIGVLSASTIDIAVLAREPAPSEPATPAAQSPQPRPSLVVLPRVTAVRDAGRQSVPILGIAGAF